MVGFRFESFCGHHAQIIPDVAAAVLAFAIFCPLLVHFL
jgi:hypothetical protein